MAQKVQKLRLARLSFAQLRVLMEPLETFVEQVREGYTLSVEHKGRDTPTLTLFGDQDPYTRARRGLAPVEAIPNIKYMLRVYLQVCRLNATPEQMEQILKQVRSFKQNFLQPLLDDTPLSQKVFVEAKNLCNNIRLVYSKSSCSNIELAIHKVLADIGDESDLDDTPPTPYTDPVVRQSLLA